MATSKKTAKTPAKGSSSARASTPKNLTISIDLGALEKLYKNRYEITLGRGDTKGGDTKGGDTKGGSVRLKRGDILKGPTITIRDGDTKGGKVFTKPGEDVMKGVGKKKAAVKTPSKTAAKTKTKSK